MRGGAQILLLPLAPMRYVPIQRLHVPGRPANAPAMGVRSAADKHNARVAQNPRSQPLRLAPYVPAPLSASLSAVLMGLWRRCFKLGSIQGSRSPGLERSLQELCLGSKRRRPADVHDIGLTRFAPHIYNRMSPGGTLVASVNWRLVSPVFVVLSDDTSSSA